MLRNKSDHEDVCQSCVVSVVLVENVSVTVANVVTVNLTGNEKVVNIDLLHMVSGTLVAVNVVNVVNAVSMAVTVTVTVTVAETVAESEAVNVRVNQTVGVRVASASLAVPVAATLADVVRLFSGLIVIVYDAIRYSFRAERLSLLTNELQVIYPRMVEREHNSSDKHKENLHWRLACCDICSCKFNSIENLMTHLTQGKHLRRLDKLKKMGLSKGSLVMSVIFDSSSTA